MTPEQLKASILQYAIQGKLVEQRPEEGTAEELYQQIQAEKQKLIKEGKIKKEKPLPEITEDEIPFDIPDSWKWVRWGELSQKIQYGYNAPAQKNGRIKMVRISDIQDNKVLWDSVPFCDISEIEIEDYLLKKNDILFARTGGTVGKSFLVEEVPEESIYAGYLIRTSYSDMLCPKYMKYFMGTQLYWNQLRNGTIATAQPNCNGQTLSKMIIPLPPLEEQHRIVAKIEELLPYVDRYAEAYEKLEQFNAKFPDDMKKSILQYAMQGKLVEQRPEEGTAEELYQQIQAEKQKLIKEGKIKKEKPLAEITEDEHPFDIPETWKWVRLGTIGITQTGNTPKKTHPEYFGTAIPFLGPGDIATNGNVTYDNQGLSEIGKEFGRITPTNSVLQVCIGGSIGKCAIVDRDVTFNQQINSIHPIIADCKFVHCILDSYYIKKYMKNNSGGTATPIINRGLWDAIVIPLPPLEEQKRIVAKIEELIPYCERLKEGD